MVSIPFRAFTSLFCSSLSPFCGARRTTSGKPRPPSWRAARPLPRALRLPLRRLPRLAARGAPGQGRPSSPPATPTPPQGAPIGGLLTSCDKPTPLRLWRTPRVQPSPVGPRVHQGRQWGLGGIVMPACPPGRCWRGRCCCWCPRSGGGAGGLARLMLACHHPAVAAGRRKSVVWNVSRSTTTVLFYCDTSQCNSSRYSITVVYCAALLRHITVEHWCTVLLFVTLEEQDVATGSAVHLRYSFLRCCVPGCCEEPETKGVDVARVWAPTLIPSARYAGRGTPRDLQYCSRSSHYGRPGDTVSGESVAMQISIAMQKRWQISQA